MMKKLLKRSMSLVLSGVICTSLVFGISTSVSAEGSLFARWSFDSVQSNNMVVPDVSGNGYNLTSSTYISPVVNLTWDAMKKTAFVGDNKQYSLTVNNSNSAFSKSQFTYTAWVKFEQDPANNPAGQAKIVDFGAIADSVREGYSFYLSKGGYVNLTLANSTGSSWITVTSTKTLSANNWHQIAASYDGSYMRVFIDGAMAGELYYRGGYKKPQGNCHIASQVRKDGSIWCSYNAKLDEVSFYDGPLSSAQIASDYKAFASRYLIDDDTVYQTIPYTGGYYAYSMTKQATARLYNNGVLEFTITTSKAAPVVRLQVSSSTRAEVLDANGSVIYKSGTKTYYVTTSGTSSRTDVATEQIPSDIISRAVYLRIY